MGPEIDITDKMSSRANESGFVFSFPLHFCVLCIAAARVCGGKTLRMTRFQYPV